MPKKKRQHGKVLLKFWGDTVKLHLARMKLPLYTCGFLLMALKTFVLISFYFSFSISLTFYNKKYVTHFGLPLSITMVHLVVKFILSWTARALLELKTGDTRIELPWSDYVKHVAPTGIVSALDIGLSNWSFEFITISLYTMCKSTAILFILMFSVLFELEKFKYSLILVVIFISGGLFMFTYHSTQFKLVGFLMVMSAAFLSGLRWTLAQIVSQRKSAGLHNPLDMMYHVQPWMMIGLLPLSVSFEGLHTATTDQLFRYEESQVILKNVSLLLMGALLAFMMEIGEFLLLFHTSSLTLAIVGIFKEVITLCLAAIINGDEMNSLNFIGLVVCLCGMILHIYLKAAPKGSSEVKQNPIPETINMLTKDGDAVEFDSMEEEEEIFVASNQR